MLLLPNLNHAHAKLHRDSAYLRFVELCFFGTGGGAARQLDSEGSAFGVRSVRRLMTRVVSRAASETKTDDATNHCGVPICHED